MTSYPVQMNVVYPSFQTTITHSNTNRDIMDIIRNQNNDLLYNYSDQIANNQLPTTNTSDNPTASRYTNPIRSEQSFDQFNPLPFSSPRDPTGFEWRDTVVDTYRTQRNQNNPPSYSSQYTSNDLNERPPPYTIANLRQEGESRTNPPLFSSQNYH
jgi:hypothetical protein